MKNTISSELISALSHDLMTPLNSIVGYSELLIMEKAGTLNEKQKDYTNEIHASGKQLRSLIADMVGLFKISAGEARLTLSGHKLSDLTESILEELSEDIAARNISVSLKMAEDALPVNVDKRVFDRIMLNMIPIAMKLIPDNGAMEIKTDIVEGEIQICTRFECEGVIEKKIKFIEKRLEMMILRQLIEFHSGKLSWKDSEGGKNVELCLTLSKL